MNDFGFLLGRLRVERKLNFTELGRKVGYDRKSLKQWEQGTIYPPNDQTIRDICEALDATDAETRELLEAAYKFHLELVDRRYPTRKLIS